MRARVYVCYKLIYTWENMGIENKSSGPLFFLAIEIE